MNKKILVFFIVFFILLANNIVIGENNIVSSIFETYNLLIEEEKKLAVIESYNIEMFVNEDSTINIVETIRTDSKALKFNIERQLPLKNPIKRLDGTEIKKNAKIKDIIVSNNCVILNRNDKKIIQLIDNDRKNSGKKIFQIRYTYDIGVFNIDELYFDLIASGWNVKIDEIAFKIKMPKDFDETKLVFFSENKKDLNVSYVVKDNIINGSFNNALESGKNLAVGLTLPKSYFKFINIPKNVLLSIITSLVFLIIVNIFYKKSKNVIIEKSFYPPNGSAGIDFILDHNTILKNKDIVPLLIYFANNGYIRIQEESEKEIKIIKIKEYDGNNENEQLIFVNLFSSRKELTINECCKTYYLILEQLNKNIYISKKTKKEYKNISYKKSCMEIMIKILFVMLVGPGIYQVLKNDEESIISRIAASIILLFTMIVLYFGSIMNYWAKPTKSNKLFVFLVIITFSFAFKLETLVLNSKDSLIYFLDLITQVISFVYILIFYQKILKKDFYSNEKRGKRLLFKEGIETITDDKINELLREDSEYFYNILPFTCLWGISDKWFNKFKTKNIKLPTWYTGGDKYFSIELFENLINNMYSSVVTDIEYTEDEN